MNGRSLRSLRTDFEASYGFSLDGFQAAAIEHLEGGRSVLVAAPTGAGKTVVGEYACYRALHTGGKCFYTTPIKALSNQKYRDLCDWHGEDEVGLLTGDRSVNGGAPIVVMTTEVLRNMIYEASPTLDGLQAVVLDEVHYLADRARGAVWEEVIIQLPQSVQLAALSATVSNAEEFGDWLSQARTGCEVVIEERRPVPLTHHYFVNDRIYPTFRAGDKGQASKEHRRRAQQALAGVPNPDVAMLERRAGQRNRVTKRGRRAGSGTRLRWPDRPTVVRELEDRRWLPAIMFVFSRQGCEDAVNQIVGAGIRLTNNDERSQIGHLTDLMLGDLPPDDLRVLDYPGFRSSLLDGVAPHHAGMVPAFKEAVEELFQRGLLKVVVATETLALGINMPAKTVVIERLEKYNGETHVMLTPGEYTQLTGRAGRRGIDSVGHAVVLYQRDIDFRSVAGLVGTRTYPLSSSFAPSYNMAVNLLRRHDRSQAEALLEASFAQFQADRSVSDVARRVRELDEALEGYGTNLVCTAGNWPAYWELREELSALEKQSAKDRRQRQGRAVHDGIAALQPGDVLRLSSLGARGLAAVVGVHLTRKGVPLASVVTDDHDLTRVGPRELDAAPMVVDRIRLPNRGNPRQSDYRDIIASKLRQVDPRGPVAPESEQPDMDPAVAEEIDALRAAVRDHACHACDDREDHEQWQYRVDDLREERQRLRREIDRRTGSLVRQFDRIVDVLQQLAYLDDEPTPNDRGMRLAGIYSEVDLLVAEALHRGLFHDLDAAELAALVSVLVYESRSDEPATDPALPSPDLRRAYHGLEVLGDELRSVERSAGLTATRELDPGFAAAAWRWAAGRTLDVAMGDLDLTGGDFVRVMKQIADLLGQLRDVGRGGLPEAASRAIAAVRRGIVTA